MQERLRKLLEEKKIDGFIGLKMEHGHPAPFMFTTENLGDLESLLVGDVRYPLNKVLLKVANQYPDLTLG